MPSSVPEDVATDPEADGDRSADSDSNRGSDANATSSRLLTGVQMLRGCSALLVILAHANLMMRYPRYFQESPFSIHDAGIFGVTIFFAISGFIIAIVSLDRDLRPRLRIGDYAWRRFLRIMPFLWVAVILYNLLSYAGTGEVEWMSAIRGMLIWPVGALKPNVIWSLRHELIFYGLFAFAMLASRRRIWLLVAWFVAPLIYGGLIQLFGRAVVPPDPVLAELLQVLLLGSDNGANLQFGIGFAIGLLFLCGHRLMQPRRTGGMAGVLAVVVLATIVVELSDMPMGLARSCLWTALAGLILWVGVISERAPGYIEQTGILLGNASFAIYLTHNGALLVAFEAVSRLHPAISTKLLFFAFVGIAVLAGLAVHMLIERPLISWLSSRQPLVPWRLRQSA